MNIYVAYITDGVVDQVTVEPAGYEAGQDQVIIGPDNTVGIGWLWDGEIFTPPNSEEE